MFWFLSLYSDLFVVVLSLFIFSALTLTFQLFTHKLCLQISGLRMGNFTWNPFPINNLLIDSLLTPSWRVHTWVYFWRILVTRSQLLTTLRTQMANSACNRGRPRTISVLQAKWESSFLKIMAIFIEIVQTPEQDLLNKQFRPCWEAFSLQEVWSCVAGTLPTTTKILYNKNKT